MDDTCLNAQVNLSVLLPTGCGGLAVRGSKVVAEPHHTVEQIPRTAVLYCKPMSEIRVQRQTWEYQYCIHNHYCEKSKRSHPGTSESV